MAQVRNPRAPDPRAGRARYTGAWARSQQAERDPQHGVLPTTDPRHATPGDQDPNPNWKAPVYPDPGDNNQVLGADDWKMAPHPGPIDRTPQSHTDGGVYSTFNTPQELQATHDDERGAGRRSRFDIPLYEFEHEHYYSARFDGSPPPAMASRAGLPHVRGIGANPLNNGPSGRNRPGRDNVTPRPGVYQWSNVNRDFAPPRRTKDYRFVRPNVVTEIGDAPPPDKPDTYSSPFSALQRMILDIKDKPMSRRVPAPFDEDLIVDNFPGHQLPVGYNGF